MDTEELTEKVMELEDAMRMLIGGCQAIADAISNHSQMLAEIRQAVTAEPEGESPLVTLLRQLVDLTEANSDALIRVEQAVTH